MNSEDYKRVEQVLQQQITTSNKKKQQKTLEQNWPNRLDSFNTINSSNSTDDVDDEEFYSMSDYNSLPPLGQPGCLVGENSGFSGLSAEKSLTNISLGGSSTLLSTMSSPPKGMLCSCIYFILESFTF